MDQLALLPPAQRYWVAYSGGCDSTVLLHALATLRDQLPVELHALHVNHNLHAAAPTWAAHCRAVCEALAIPLYEVNVDARAAKGESPEAAARAARYRIFTEVLKTGDGLLLAHHRDDQAETLLLQLLRGSGPRGLAGMPAHRPQGAGWLGRPLLHFSRQDLCRYAEAEKLQWIDDPSNFDTDFDRNFLRQRVVPLLQERWPAAATTLARAADHQAEAAELLHQLAEEDWRLTAGPQADTLRIECLLQLTPERQRNVLRYWIDAVNALPLPDRQRLRRILTEVIPAAADAEPCIRWPGGQVRRYAGLLYLLASEPASISAPLKWDLSDGLELGDGRTLLVTPVSGEGLKVDLPKTAP
ncbi:MAG: tRNA lysidine(34) synthetase TilS, partial [Halobacteria archaeon]|nr:tRNA lysidine(34) synthetase TilS [Halobacteria archaeon]